MFNARPVVYILYRKHLDDNIHKQWEWGGNGVLASYRFWEIGKGDTKKGG
jgi:hypothetical protein